MRFQTPFEGVDIWRLSDMVRQLIPAGRTSESKRSLSEFAGDHRHQKLIMRCQTQSSRTKRLKLSVRSFTKRLNSRGPKTLPWATPLMTESQGYSEEFIRTHGYIFAPVQIFFSDCWISLTILTCH